jgi:hypothetical protein
VCRPGRRRADEPGQRPLPGQAQDPGGRVEVRAPLHMACLVAIQHNPALKRFYRRLREAGKPARLASSPRCASCSPSSMPFCATTNPGHRPTAERRSDGSHTGCGERRLKAVSRAGGGDSARLEPPIDAADPSAITSILDVQDSRSLDLFRRVERSQYNTRREGNAGLFLATITRQRAGARAALDPGRSRCWLALSL